MLNFRLAKVIREFGMTLYGLSYYRRMRARENDSQ